MIKKVTNSVNLTDSTSNINANDRRLHCNYFAYLTQFYLIISHILVIVVYPFIIKIVFTTIPNRNSHHNFFPNNNYFPFFLETQDYTHIYFLINFSACI